MADHRLSVQPIIRWLHQFATRSRQQQYVPSSGVVDRPGPICIHGLVLLLAIEIISSVYPLRLYAQSPLPIITTPQQVYLPVAVAQGTPTTVPTSTPTPLPTATPTVAPTAAAECNLNAEEAQLADLLRNDPGQMRASLTCNVILARVAREKALDMATRGYFGHVNPDGYGPNYLVEQAGYILPSYYNHTPSGNNIESLAGGYSTAENVWSAWTSSTNHRMHVLGEHPFFAEQIEYGVGHVYDAASSHKHYWVLLTAKPGP